MKLPAYDLRPCPLSVVEALCARHHGYGSASKLAVYAFAVYELGVPVAAFAWQPPPVGAARAVCPEAPSGVLALSRMVAVPRAERALRHVSKPLRRQMLVELDRGRWPVLVTYHDEGEGHTGHVYKCSGWRRAEEPRTAPVFLDAEGRRASRYANGLTNARAGLVRAPDTVIWRWEHRACPEGEAAAWMAAAGWRRVAVPGKVWKSGNQAHTWERERPDASTPPPW